MSDLLSQPEGSYGTEYKKHLFDQYELYVTSADKVSDRRQAVNSYFITVNTALLSLLGLSFQTDALKNSDWIKLILATIGILACVLFYFLIRSYKQLNAGKFEVIHEIEQYLPLRLFAHEWELLGKGEDHSRYYPFSHIETIIPWIFGLIYVVVAVYFAFRIIQ